MILSGLSVSFLLELVLLRYTSYDSIQQTRLINSVRLCYVIFAGVWLLYSYLTYRDYEAMNHQMLVSLMEKVNSILRREKEVEDELPGHVDCIEDPDYVLPEITGENLIMSIPERRYNLRRR